MEINLLTFKLDPYPLVDGVVSPTELLTIISDDCAATGELASVDLQPCSINK